jgi:hypothetical protein
MVTIKQISKFVGLHDSTIRQSYIKKENKKNHLQCLKIGTFLALNGVSEEELIALVAGLKATKQFILDKIKTN